MRPAEEALLERALAAEGEADSLAARRDWAGAAAALSQAADLLKSRQAALRTDAPPLYWYEEWEERGALAACRCLYKKAGCCLMLGRWQDSMRASKAALGLASWQLDREGGWGKEPFGPNSARALYRWGQALHSLQHLAETCPDATLEQVEALEGAGTAADGGRLSAVPLPPPGARPSAAAADALRFEVLEPVLCSSAELVAASAGLVMHVASGRCVQLDCWHALRANAEAPPPALPPEGAPRGARVPVAFLRGEAAVLRRHLQPLGPLLAAYMSQRWHAAPGSELPEAPLPEGEGSDGEEGDDEDF